MVAYTKPKGWNKKGKVKRIERSGGGLGGFVLKVVYQVNVPSLYTISAWEDILSIFGTVTRAGEFINEVKIRTSKARSGVRSLVVSDPSSGQIRS